MPKTLPNETRRRLLKYLEANPDADQRALDRERDNNLGKVNYCLRALLDRGWIKVRNVCNSDNKLVCKCSPLRPLNDEFQSSAAVLDSLHRGEESEAERVAQRVLALNPAINHGADLRSVEMLLGHSELATTRIYTHVAHERLKNPYARHHLRGRNGRGSARVGRSNGRQAGSSLRRSRSVGAACRSKQFRVL